MSDFLYFGCASKESIGHYLFAPGMRSAYEMEKRTPWKYERLDGLFRDGNQSACTLFSLAGWSGISMPDRSADRRPASNAVFIAKGDYGFTALVELFEEKFPAPFARISAAAPLHLREWK